MAGALPAFADPNANAGPNQEVNERTVVTLDGTGSVPDEDNGPITYFWDQINGQTVELTGANTPNPSFTAPAVENDLTLRFRLIVTDAEGEDDTDTVNVRVINTDPPSTPPQANAGPDQQTSPGATVTLDGSGTTDPNGDAITFVWSQVSGPQVNIENATTPNPSFVAPAVSGPETVVIRLQASDASGATTDDVAVVVAAAEDLPPVANAGADQTVLPGAVVELNPSGSSDPEGQPLSFSWTQISGPSASLTPIDPAAGRFSFPANAPAGTVYGFRVSVRDPGGAEATDDVAITVGGAAENGAPRARASGPRQVRSSETVTLDGTRSTDPEGQPLTFVWTQVEGFPVAFLPVASSPVVTFVAPVVPSPTEFLFRLTVTDVGGLTSSDDVRVRVRPSGDVVGVTAEAGANQSILGGGTVALTGAGSDPTGQPVSFAWEQIGGPAVTLVNANSATAGFTAPAVASATDLTFRLTVTGPSGAATDTVVVTLLPPPAPEPQQERFSTSLTNFSIYPNPFDAQGQVTFQFDLGSDSDIEILVYDMFGRVVKEVTAGRGGAGGVRGRNQVFWDGRNGQGETVANGGYIVQIKATGDDGGTARETGRLAVVK